MSNRVLFIGIGQSPVAWYRCYLPAQALDLDHVGLVGEPPHSRYVTGLVTVPGKEQRQSSLPNFTDYDVVVLQQPAGRGWLKFIRALQESGIKVLYEIDDYLHGIRNTPDHDFREAFGKEQLAGYELCMRVCDGLIASTEYIARRYRKFNPITFTCENGLDLKRYQLTKPPRETVNIGWAGATGHHNAMQPWLKAVRNIMESNPRVNFVSIGKGFANNPILAEFEETRRTAIPWCAVEQYPAAMTLFDIALGPAGRTAFHAGKSDLRWLEAGALGIPIVADPFTYGGIRDGYDGVLVGHAIPTTEEIERRLLELITDPELRTTIGENARGHVQQHRAIEIAAGAWREPLALE